jgi:hypothetical protein
MMSLDDRQRQALPLEDNGVRSSTSLTREAPSGSVTSAAGKRPPAEDQREDGVSLVPQCGALGGRHLRRGTAEILSNFDGVEMATGLDVAGDIAFLGHRCTAFSASTCRPRQDEAPVVAPTDESQSVYYRNGLLLSGDWAGGEVTVIDVSGSARPWAVSKIGLDGTATACA